MSSAYFPRVNGRAEVAVKTAKRLMRSNDGQGEMVNNDKFLRAILQLRNTPDPDCGVSPAEIVFGRPMRDNLSFTHGLTRKSCSERWKQAWSAKEEALRARFIRTSEKLNMHSRQLPPLQHGEKCFVQNQHGPLRNKWHNTGTVMEALPFDQYIVQLDGSRRLTTRNRKFLRGYTPAVVTTEPCPMRTSIEPAAIVSPCDSPALDDTTKPDGSGCKATFPDDNNEYVADTTPNNGTVVSIHEPPTTSRTDRPVPRALSRLQDYNSPGIKEESVSRRR